ncbi:MAG: hypothetical protein ACLFU8_10310 [Anaerolineales bacterium]
MTAADAPALLDYVEAVSGESDFLSFGPGEFELSVAEEEDYLRSCREAENQIYLLGLADGRVVSALNFTGGRRPRLRHSGEFGITVRKTYEVRASARGCSTPSWRGHGRPAS